jgi:ADP-heptose:LPS heptosyltransferase
VLELAQQAHPGFTVVFCGTAGDRPVLEKARTAWQGKSFVMAGDLSLLGVVLLLQKCRAVVTTDSGPRHLSNASGVPVYFVRNPWFSPIEAGVYCPETEYDGAPVTGQIAPELQKAWFEEVDLAAMASHLATRLGRISP